MSQSSARAWMQRSTRGKGNPLQGCSYGFQAKDILRKGAIFCALCLLSGMYFGLHAQADDKSPDKQSDTGRVRIEVTGGDAKKPVADASVYLKFVEDRKILRDRTIEFNLKTNQEGVARSPEVPKGKILIQIVAPGWKTFGQYYELDQDEQTIEIHLIRPTTKWY